MSRRHVHVTINIEQGDDLIHLSPSDAEFVRPFKNYKSENFWSYVEKFKALKQFGASEIFVVRSDGTQKNFGGWPWYNCQSMIRDWARLECGFVGNPLHLAYKLRKGDGKNYQVLSHVEL